MQHSIDHLIQRHLDGELSGAERAEFEQLLQRSPEAREELRRAEQIRSAVRRTATMRQPSAWVEQELMAMIRSAAATATPVEMAAVADRSPVQRGRMRRATATVAAVACMLLIALQISDGPLVSEGPRAATEPRNGEIASTLLNRTLPPVVLPASDHFTTRPALINRRRVLLRANNELSTPEQQEPRQNQEAPRNGAVQEPNAQDIRENAPVKEPNTPTTTIAEGKEPEQRSEFPKVNDTWTPSALDQPSLLSASVRGGYAGIRRDNWETANEMQVRLGLRLSEKDQVYAVVGSAPTITETRYRNSGLGVSAAMSSNGKGKNDDEGKGGNSRVLSSTPPALSVSFDDELWGGVGYRRTLLEGQGMQLAASAQAGTSGTAARFAGELSGSIKVLPRLSFEVSGSVTQVLPFTREVEVSTAIVNDGPRPLYNSTVRQPAFVSVGAQVGIRYDLP